MQQLEMRERLENIKNESDPLSALDLIAKEVKASTKTMMDGFAQSFGDGQLDEAREWIRKLQFMQKAEKEIFALTADIEDELLG